MKALVIGASGATGKDLVFGLLLDPHFSEVHIFLRRPYDIENPKLHVHIINFDKPETWKQLVSGDVAFSCLGTTLKDAGSKEAQYKVDFGYQYEFAKAARENNVEDYILVSAYGADPKSRIFYSRMKGELEAAVKKLHFNKITIFCPGMLERKDSKRQSEVFSAKVIKFANRFGILERMKPIPTEVLAQAMIKASQIKSSGYSKIKLSNIFSFAHKTDSL